MSIHGGLRAAAAASPPRAETRRGRHREVQGRTERRTRGARMRLVGKPSRAKRIEARVEPKTTTHVLASALPRSACPVPLTVRGTVNGTGHARARPFPLLSPRAAKSGATTRLRVYAAIFTVFSAGKKATRGEEEISTARVYSHAAGIAHGTRRLAQTPRNRPLPQASTTPVRRPASGLWRPRPWPATSRCCWTASFLKMTLPVMWRPSRL